MNYLKKDAGDAAITGWWCDVCESIPVMIDAQAQLVAIMKVMIEKPGKWREGDKL